MYSLTRLAIAIALVAAVSGCLADPPDVQPDPESPALTATLSPAPDFELASLAGGSLNSEELKGKVVVLDFWATWCGPCVEEIPNYNALFHEQDSDEFAIVGVTLESGPIDDVRPFIDDLGIEYPVVMGDSDIVADFGGVNAFPMTFVLSPDWKVYKRYIGLLTSKKEQIEQDVIELTTAFQNQEVTRLGQR